MKTWNCNRIENSRNLMYQYKTNRSCNFDAQYKNWWRRFDVYQLIWTDLRHEKPLFLCHSVGLMPKKRKRYSQKILCETIEVELRNTKMNCTLCYAYNPAYITFIENDTNCMLAPIEHARLLVVRKIIDQLFWTMNVTFNKNILVNY